MFAYFAGLRLFLLLSFEIFGREIGARAAKIDLQRMLDVRSLSGSSLLTENLTHHKKMTQNILAPFSMFHPHIYLTQSAP